MLVDLVFEAKHGPNNELKIIWTQILTLWPQMV